MKNDSQIKELSDATYERIERGRKSQEDGSSFEKLVAELYRLLGYDVEHGRIFDKRQVDLILTGHFGDLTIIRAIECKAGSVKAEHFDSFIAKLRLVRHEYPSAQGTIISGGLFTDAISAQAAREGIQLTSYRDLAAKLLDGHRYAKGIIRECESNERYQLNLYIEPYLSYEPTGTAISAFEVIDDWLRDSRWNQLTLLGDVGTGKSFLSRMLAYRLAKNYLEDPMQHPVPILIDLRNADRQFSLEGLVLTHLSQNGLDRISFDVFQYSLTQGNIVFILDGFDEMASRVTPQVTNRNFHELSRCVKGQAKVFLTCRTHYFKSRTEEEEVILGGGKDYGSETARDLYWELISRKGFKIAYLRPFVHYQIEEYVQKANPKHYNEAISRIRNTYNLMELSQRPMLLEMIVKSIDKLTTAEINPATLYKVYTNAWIHRDQWRDVLSPEAKLSYLMALAYSLWIDDTVNIHYSQLTEYLQHALSTKIHNPQQLFEIDNEIRTASFLTQDEFGNYGFAHKSYLEFFIARFLSYELNDGNIDCLHTRRFSQEIIRFLRYMIELEKIQPLLENILKNNYRLFISENALAILYGFQRELFIDKKLTDQEDGKKLIVALPDGINLNGSQLDQMNLEGALLVKSDLSGANLSQAILAGANLSHSIISDANLEKADLTRAILSDANLNSSIMTGVNLEGANLTNAILVKTNLTDAYLLQTLHEGIDLNEAILTRAILPDELSSLLSQKRVSDIKGLEADRHQIIINSLYPYLMKVAKKYSIFMDIDEEDIVHEALIDILKSKSLEKMIKMTEEDREDYLSGIIRDAAISKTKQQLSVKFERKNIFNYLDLLHFEEPNPEDYLIASDIKEISIDEIENILPLIFWRILKARYIDELKLSEIAAKEQFSQTTIYRYLNKAREIVRKHFE